LRFLLDHDVPDRIGHVLAAEGHDVAFLREVMSAEAPDPDVLAFAANERLVLLTCNRGDFLELARSNEHAGLIVVFRRRNRVLECAAVLRLIERAGESGIRGNVNFA